MKPDTPRDRIRVLKLLKEFHTDKNSGCEPQAKQKFLVCSNALTSEELQPTEKYPDMTFQDYFATTEEGQKLVAAHGSAAQAAKEAADNLERVRQDAAKGTKAARAAEQEAAKRAAAAEQEAAAAEQAAAAAAAEAAEAAKARAGAAASEENKARAEQAAEANNRAQYAARAARRAAAEARSLEAQKKRELEILMQAQIDLGMGTAENPFDLTGGGRRASIIATRFSSTLKRLQ